MTDPSPRRLLDPTDRFSEILFGLIMVMTFTGTLSVAESGREDVREMLIGALGCNLAWGIADAVMYVLTAMATRGRGHVLLRELKAASDPAEGHRKIVEALPERVAAVLGPDELESMRRRLIKLPDSGAAVALRLEDFWSALLICLLVFLSTFPVAVPFLFVHDARPALRLSNGVALLMLFVLGHSLGRYAGGRPWRFGLGMLVLGAVLVAVIIALGG